MFYIAQTDHRLITGYISSATKSIVMASVSHHTWNFHDSYELNDSFMILTN